MQTALESAIVRHSRDDDRVASIGSKCIARTSLVPHIRPLLWLRPDLQAYTVDVPEASLAKNEGARTAGSLKSRLVFRQSQTDLRVTSLTVVSRETRVTSGGPTLVSPKSAICTVLAWCSRVCSSFLSIQRTDDSPAAESLSSEALAKFMGRRN